MDFFIERGFHGLKYAEGIPSGDLHGWICREEIKTNSLTLQCEVEILTPRTLPKASRWEIFTMQKDVHDGSKSTPMGDMFVENCKFSTHYQPQGIILRILKSVNPVLENSLRIILSQQGKLRKVFSERYGILLETGYNTVILLPYRHPEWEITRHFTFKATILK